MNARYLFMNPPSVISSVLKAYSILILMTSWSIAQQSYTRIHYEISTNGEVSTPYNHQNASVLFVSPTNLSYLSKERVFSNQQEAKDVLTIFTNDSTFYQGTFLKKSETIWHKDSTSHASAKLIKQNHTKKILGYNCQLFETTLNSNKINLWVTTEIKGHGGPTTLGFKEGVVLELTINEGYKITAKKIQKVVGLPQSYIEPTIDHIYDKEEYRYLQWQNLFTKIPIIDSAFLGFSPDQKNYNDTYIHAGNGTIVIREITFPPFENEQLYLEVTQRSTGDAYDRTGTVFLLTENQKDIFLEALKTDLKKLPSHPKHENKYHGTVMTSDYQPPFELMRFFTTFGTGHYNYLKVKNQSWLEESYFRQNISEFSSLLSGKKVFLGFNIGTWTPNGHIISANITTHPSDDAPFENIIPLFNTVPIMEMSGQEYPHHFLDSTGIEVEFELLQDEQDVRFRLITTGHGGHSKGDEFSPKENKVYLDSVLIFSVYPWKSDCGTYRNQNPASGNFENGLSSSDLSRSNWCPGQITNPFWIPLGKLKAGKHKIRLTIPETPSKQGENNTWYVSGTLFY